MHGVGYDSLVHKRYALSAWKSMKACMRREIILVYRHSFVYLFRIAQVCLGLLVTFTEFISHCKSSQRSMEHVLSCTCCQRRACCLIVAEEEVSVYPLTHT